MTASTAARATSAASARPWGVRIARTGTALRYLKRLIRPPGEGYSLEEINALGDLVDNACYERIAQRVAASPEGAQMLASRPSFYDSATIEELSRLPADTLGGAFARFMQSQDLEPNISAASPFPASEDAEFIKARHRESHDLVHVLLALGIEPRDEVLLQAFNLGQHARWLSLAVVLGGLFKHGRWGGEPALLREVIDAYRVGRHARLLLLADWESMWPLSLNEVRGRLGLRVVADAAA